MTQHTVKNPSHSKLAAVLFSLSFMTSLNAATVVYSQPVSNSQWGLYSNSPASATSDQQLADAFTISESYSISSVTWYGTEEASTTLSQFTIQFYEDNLGSPAAVPLSITALSATPTATGLTNAVNSRTIYSYTATLPDIRLQAGSYWVNIVESDASTTGSWLWQNSETGDIDNKRTASHTGGLWETFGGDRGNRAFSLFGSSVPEPSSISLLGISLLALITKRRRE